MRVEPVSPYPPATSRTLEQWLDPAYAAQVSAEVQTRLRDIADAQAMRRALWAAFLSLGVSAMLFATVVFSLNGNRGMLTWAVVGAVLVLVSVPMMRRSRSRIPRPGAILTTRGAGSLGGGLRAAGAIFLAINVFLLPATVLNGRLISVVFIELGVLLLLASAFVVPAAVIGGARSSLRRTAQRDPRMQEALEGERLAWTPTPGVPMFGPL